MKRYSYFICYSMYNNLRKYIGNKDIIINTNIKIIDNKQLKNIKKIIIDDINKINNNNIDDIIINCINLLYEEDLGNYVQ